jgi:hypothetical protein
MGIRRGRPETLPFGVGDVTAGSENELQTVVIGDPQSADLPRTVAESGFFANVSRRVAAGDAPRRTLQALQSWLHDNAEGVWENSWVRFPQRLLSPGAAAVLATDLAADRRQPAAGQRQDVDRFLVSVGGESMVRVPVSYLLKLALADSLYADPPRRRHGARPASACWGISSVTTPRPRPAPSTWLPWRRSAAMGATWPARPPSASC